MIKHIVMWKLHEKAEGYTKQENLVRIKQELHNLKEIIPKIMKWEVGANINNTSQAFDLVLYSEFSDLQDLKIYHEHSAHIQFKSFINGLRSHVHVVDYDIHEL